MLKESENAPWDAGKQKNKKKCSTTSEDLNRKSPRTFQKVSVTEHNIAETSGSGNWTESFGGPKKCMLHMKHSKQTHYGKNGK